MKKITLKEYMEETAEQRAAFIQTWRGMQRIDYVLWWPNDPWVVDTDGHHWCVCASTTVYLETNEGISDTPSKEGA